ncbi:MAG TPA: phosphotransferase, partial [Longimicrobiaceae bacterium]|nr:phosphotransferase [Longimicrobiaceae bacterium]
MILTPRNLVHYLLDRGLATPATGGDGDFAVHEATRRNRNFRVRRGAGRPGLFVKQPQDWEPHSADTLRREATCYLLARDDPGFAALRELLPGFVDYDPAHSVLVLERLPGGESLADWHRRRGGWPPEMGERLGGMLGRCHRQAAARAAGAAHDRAFPRAIPWILDLLNHNPAHLGPVSGGNRELLEMVERHAGFGRALDAARAGWRREALVHGDLKWENCVVLPGADPAALPEVRMVDWELADFGDPCWDVGSLFQSYLSFWILSLPAESAAAPPDPPAEMQAALRACWEAYTATLEADADAAAALLRRSTAYAAARMIQTAWEYSAYSPQVTPGVLLLLQVSLNVLTRPA